MNSGLTVLSSLSAGALSMYLFDPGQGRRRRAVLRDRSFHVLRRGRRFVRVGVRDLSHRAQGVVAGASHILRHEQPSDDVLVSRVRAAIGRVCSHPHAIEVTAVDGRVTLSGPVLRRDVDKILSRVYEVDGVKDVESKLELHAETDRISSLQGGRPKGFDRFELMQSNWPPGARVLVIAASIAPLLYGLKRRDAFGVLISVLSSGFLARAVTNIEAKRLFGMETLREIAPTERLEQQIKRAV